MERHNLRWHWLNTKADISSGILGLCRTGTAWGAAAYTGPASQPWLELQLVVMDPQLWNVSEAHVKICLKVVPSLQLAEVIPHVSTTQSVTNPWEAKLWKVYVELKDLTVQLYVVLVVSNGN